MFNENFQNYINININNGIIICFTYMFNLFKQINVVYNLIKKSYLIKQ